MRQERHEEKMSEALSVYWVIISACSQAFGGAMRNDDVYVVVVMVLRLMCACSSGSISVPPVRRIVVMVVVEVISIRARGPRGRRDFDRDDSHRFGVRRLAQNCKSRLDRARLLLPHFGGGRGDPGAECTEHLMFSDRGIWCSEDGIGG